MSHNKKFDDNLLQEKKDRFVEATLKASTLVQKPTPKVNFLECTEYEYNHLAHYHPDENKVCVSRDSLIEMDYDDILETAIHEVTHMLVDAHDSEFRKVEGNISTGIWEPPKGLGLAHIDPTNSRNVKLKARKVKKGECNSYSCLKKGKVECSFCERSFCEKHSSARQAGMVDRGSDDIQDRLRVDSMESGDGHPCFQFVEEPSAYEPNSFDSYRGPAGRLSDEEVKYFERVVESPKAGKKKVFVSGDKLPSKMFDGRPLQDKRKENEEIGFWKWLKSLLWK